MKAFLLLLFLIWAALALLALGALTQTSGWMNLAAVAVLILAAKNAAGLFSLLRQ